jgi:predicted MFS family arabinose efflux permease
MAPLGAVLILLVIFGSITSVILGLVYLKNKNRERMIMMEKGVDASIFKEEFRNTGNFSLKTGIFLIGIALGIIFGAIAAQSYIFPHEEASYFSAIFLFGGISLIVGSLVDKKRKN